MTPSHPRIERLRAWTPILLAILVLGGAGLALRSAPLSAQNDAAAPHHSHGDAMSDAAMARWVKDWFAQHPIVGAEPSPSATVADTFLSSGFAFDTDGSAATQVDTAHILTGQSILWRNLSGSHTATNGTGFADPNAGTMFDAPLNTTTDPTFSFTFGAAGTYPFFCRVHEGFNMRGVVVVADPAAADTFTASGTQFDTDGNPGTQVDTAFIFTGESILWKQLSGIHTVTNGTGSTDPSAGTKFDVPLDGTSTTFSFTFNDVGEFPFFCRPHEGFDMRGVVVVHSPVAAEPGTGSRGHLGFLSDPTPNPTTGGVSFRVAMPTAGRASLRVIDSRGQLVAEPFDRRFEAGTFDGGWNGITRQGVRAAPGVYYLRLTMTGFSATRRIVIAR